MSDKMNEAILETIQENLPAASVDLIKNSFNEFDKLKSDYELSIKLIQNLRDEVKDKESGIVKLKQKIEEMEKEFTILMSLRNREKNIDKRERDYELAITKIKLEEADLRFSDLFKLVDKVMGHPNVTVTRNFNRNGDNDIPVEGGNGCGGYIGKSYHNSSETETVTTTQDKK